MRRFLKEIHGIRRGIGDPPIYCGDHLILRRTIYGQKMFLDARDCSITPHLALDGFWEIHVTNVFLNALREGMTVVDVGANVGYYTLLAASRVGKNGRVIAFEPDPEMFDVLFKNVDINGFLDRVTLIEKAVSFQTKRLTFHKMKHHRGGGSLHRFSGEYLKQLRDEIQTIEVESTSLDEYFENKDRKVSLIKIDTEGSEPFIIQGARQLLSENPNLILICEFSPGLIKAGGNDPMSFLNQLESMGFALRIIASDSRILRKSKEELANMALVELYLTK
jgi:FkbM family methyltransferase